MNSDSFVTLRRKKNNKIKTFFKVLKCTRADKLASKSFELVKKQEDDDDIPIKTKSVIKYSQAVQTVDGLRCNVSTQASLDSKPKLQEYNIDYFKQILDDNQNLHSRDILIENRRLALTRVISTISLKISSHFNYFILKTQVKVVNNLFYDNFVRILSRSINYNLILMLRSFVNLSRICYYRNVELSNLLDSKDLNQVSDKVSSLSISRYSKSIEKLDLSCVYMCKVISTVLLCRKYKYFNAMSKPSSLKLCKTTLYRPMSNVIEPLDFFLTT